jgi:hypothetical protein
VSRRSKPVDQTDLGPEIQIERGDLVVQNVPDPERLNRTIRRARRAWIPDVLLGKGTILECHHAACVRYLEAHERGALGVCDRPVVFVGGGRGGLGPGEVQLACLADARKARTALGRRLAEAVDWCVLGTGTVEGFAKHRGINGHHASGYLLAAMDRLVEHYGH